MRKRQTKLTKTDELVLLGDIEELKKHLKIQLKRAITYGENTLRSLDSADVQWPNEGVTERAHLRELTEHAIERSKKALTEIENLS